ncbi:alpha/beta fold hydrolase [Bacillus luteolus]|uniref:Alpha/beta fold hydrolase n=2 Tax=Litchfieldia luteola TaxID=682179 RepID=A0ABR9QL89_9BACI|nr:alpha/beta fold hydrolase [Cytobacillus luteolus]
MLIMLLVVAGCANEEKVFKEEVVEEKIIVGENTEYELNGTLTLPKDNQEALPAVVLIHGSGPSDQDETAFAYKPFRDIAWGLAQQGIAVIRYDKRTYAHGNKMAQQISEITVYEETVEDAIRAAQLLKKDNRIDENKVFVVGHSLGGMLAPRIDMQGGNFAGIIMLGSSPRPLWEIAYDQNIAALKKQEMRESSRKQQDRLIEIELEKALLLQEMTDSEANRTTVFGIGGYYLKEMEQFSAKSIILQAEKPILIMQGEDDFQVYYEKDFKLWQELLEEHKNVTLVSYPKLNHFFVQYEGQEKGTIDEYMVPGNVDLNVIKDIGDWILKQK